MFSYCCHMYFNCISYDFHMFYHISIMYLLWNMCLPRQNFRLAIGFCQSVHKPDYMLAFDETVYAPTWEVAWLPMRIQREVSLWCLSMMWGLTLSAQINGMMAVILALWPASILCYYGKVHWVITSGSCLEIDIKLTPLSTKWTQYDHNMDLIWTHMSTKCSLNWHPFPTKKQFLLISISYPVIMSGCDRDVCVYDTKAFHIMFCGPCQILFRSYSDLVSLCIFNFPKWSKMIHIWFMMF